MSTASKLIETVHNGRDNAIDLLLTSDGVAVDLSITTRMTITVGAVTVDSDVTPIAFDWSGGSGLLRLGLGNSSIPAGELQEASLIVYDAVNPNGIEWGKNKLLISVYD